MGVVVLCPCDLPALIAFSLKLLCVCVCVPILGIIPTWKRDVVCVTFLAGHQRTKSVSRRLRSCLTIVFLPQFWWCNLDCCCVQSKWALCQVTRMFQNGNVWPQEYWSPCANGTWFGPFFLFRKSKKREKAITPGSFSSLLVVTSQTLSKIFASLLCSLCWSFFFNSDTGVGRWTQKYGTKCRYKNKDWK